MKVRVSHLSVRGCNHDDGSVHARRTRDHVLDVVGMAGTVDVRVMSAVGFVLDMRRRNGDAAFALLWGFIDGTVLEEIGKAFVRLSLCDCSCEGSL